MDRGKTLLRVAACSAATIWVARGDAAGGPLWDASPGQPGMNGQINTLYAAGASSPTGAALLAGGEFTSAGGADIAGVAKWDGRVWQPVGGGPPIGEVLSITTFEGELFASGVVGLPGLARWDGLAWTTVADAPTSWLGGLGVFDSGGGPELFVSGGFIFFQASDGFAAYAARWNGSTWFSAGELASVVHRMLVWDDGAGTMLYGAGSMGIALAGGGFCTGAGGWDGAGWSPLGGCLGGVGNALAVFDDGSGEALYYGGSFFQADGQPVQNVAAWDGATWSPLGSGVNGEVFALAVFDDGSGPALYAGGAFSEAGGDPAGHLARWDGSSWTAVGDGADGPVTALATFGERTGEPVLAVAGEFTTIGGLSANRIAFLHPVPPGPPGDLDGDGVVDVSDFLSLLAAWGPCPDPPAGCDADLDGDDAVGVTDLLLLLANWTA